MAFLSFGGENDEYKTLLPHTSGKIEQPSLTDMLQPGSVVSPVPEGDEALSLNPFRNQIQVRTLISGRKMLISFFDSPFQVQPRYWQAPFLPSKT